MHSVSRFLSMFSLIAVVLTACSTTPSARHAGSTDPQGVSVSEALVTPGATPAPQNKTSASSALTAKLSEIAGTVQARQSQGASFAAATNGEILQVLGQLQTQSDGKARLDFSTGTLVRVGPNTLFTLQPSGNNSQGLIIQLQLDLGQLWVILQGGGSLQVQTKSGVAAVLGSFLGVNYNPQTGDLRITCLEGHCSLTTPEGTVDITTGQAAEVTGPNQTPQVSTMTQQDYLDWLDSNPESSPYVEITATPVTTTDATPAPGANHKGGQGKAKGKGGGLTH